VYRRYTILWDTESELGSGAMKAKVFFLRETFAELFETHYGNCLGESIAPRLVLRPHD
jgi:hypothetical protein